MFVPNNKAFEALPKVYDKFYQILPRKMLILDHILIGQKTSGNLNSKMTEEVTVTNKSIQFIKESLMQGYGSC